MLCDHHSVTFLLADFKYNTENDHSGINKSHHGKKSFATLVSKTNKKCQIALCSSLLWVNDIIRYHLLIVDCLIKTLDYVTMGK